ncbi:MAG TPA: ABC transporter permease [Desulfobacteraceae bacterium]|nr:ABC transporter permease [Desulfobacteraceae bacterium]
MFWVRMAIRELRVTRGFSLFFILNLSIGLAGFVAVQSFGRSLDRHMDRNLREILTADLVLTATSPMTPEESVLTQEVLGPEKDAARLVAFYTMIRPMGTAGGTDPANADNPGSRPPARLVRVMAVDRAYPLYGKFILENNIDPLVLQASPGLFMTRDTALTLGLRDEAGFAVPLRLGEKDFHIRGFFLEDPDKSLTAVDLAPKVYMGLEQLDGTGLVRFGSRIRYFYCYTFPEGRDVPALSRKLSARFFEHSRGKPRINIFDTRDVNRRLGRLTGYFTGYMGLVSIVALFLAGISGAYLFRGVVTLKQKQMAILMSTGAIRREIYGMVSLQLILLGSLASMLAVAAAYFLMPAFPVIFKGLVPEGLDLAIDPLSVLLALGMGMGGSLLFCLPVFARLFSFKPGALLQDVHAYGGENTGSATHRRFDVLRRGLAFIPGLAAFFGVSVLVAGSPRDGLVFACGFILALALLSVAGGGVFYFCGILARRPGRSPVLKIAFRNLFRNRWSSLSCFVTISMGVFLISLIPQIQKGLESEIMRPEGLKLPVFFLVDIQDEQKQPLMDFLSGQPGELTHISPVVNGRIQKINGRPFFEHGSDTEPSRGRVNRMRGRRLEFIFSYRKELADSETLVKGRPMTRNPWVFGSAAPFEISMAVSFADRFGFKIGDVIEFDVQGIPLTGRVVNLRKVRWNSFQPNFFLLFQDGVLNDAPKTYLGAISNVAPDLRAALKNNLVDRFSNISVIDVTQTAATILGVTDRLSLSVRFMAWLAIGAGLVSIFSIARHEARKNRNQINLLKVLGCGRTTLQGISLLEFGFIGFTASLFALALSAGFSLGISWWFFDNLWRFDAFYLAAILTLATGVCMGTGLAAVRRVANARPLDLLN